MVKITDEDIENYPSIAPILIESRRRRKESRVLIYYLVGMTIIAIMVLIKYLF